jgi:hypothetical protein
MDLKALSDCEKYEEIRLQTVDMFQSIGDPEAAVQWLWKDVNARLNQVIV